MVKLSDRSPRIVSVSRRDALRFGVGLAVAGSVPALLGCKAPAAGPVAPKGAATCGPPTHAQIEGPYYRPGAPERAVLVAPSTEGIPLVIEGRVTGPGCARGLADVELDVWQANHAGHYDNDGSMRLPADAMLLRGRLKTDGDGRYRITTIVPGRYLNGRQYRPSHVHVKLRGKGLRELTTQLYFPGDPFNDVDPFIHESLVMPTEKRPSEWRSRFDFVLQAVT
jgi:protocatechuate 3,4-dioxygenase beta subunit